MKKNHVFVAFLYAAVLGSILELFRVSYPKGNHVIYYSQHKYNGYVEKLLFVFE